MTTPIVLYDENHERVGETFPRRAKQLVKSGRATGLEEGKSLFLDTDFTPYPPSEEDVIMEETTYTNDGITVAEPVAKATEGSNDLLLYVAKKNVAEKRSLIKHLIAYILAWPLIHLLTNMIGVSYASSVAVASESVDATEMFMRGGMTYHFRLPWGEYVNINATNGVWASIEDMLVAHAIDWAPMSSTAVSTITRNDLWWHFALGVMVTWSVWIVMRSIKILRRRFKSSAPKIDPVALEYERLRAAH